MPAPGSKFERTMYVTAYELARDGLSDSAIGRALGVAGPTFIRWCGRDHALADAVARGRHRRDPHDEYTFHEYIYGHLPPQLREVWDHINNVFEQSNGYELVEGLLSNHGIRARQHLFMYSLVQSAFNVSQSLRKLNISRKTYDSWCQNDPDFASLMEEIVWYRDNFFEEALIGRVTAGDTAAILHVARTKLRHRGYNERIEVEHSGSVRHEHSVAITELDLPMDTRLAILEAVRAHRVAQNAPSATLPGRGVPTTATTATTAGAV